ncbi:hypothetical protein L1987_53993 [Smallanthus sonchifolius]|uniref:Uncharacterized protein n=1 Tax=Smallanthus sonchifolius TaxID=185202 RepID=A0ACB9E5J5_9ASTR|nr:hypothetical protein L1987_53993 [Smallanthus sonchifolius]
MDKLPHSLLLQILSQLDDSAEVARCRVASKSFDTVFPDLRSINLEYSLKWYNSSRSSVSSDQHIKPFKTVFLELISKLRIVESVGIGPEHPLGVGDDFYLADGDFAKEWLPSVSKSLKLLSISGLRYHSRRQSNILPLISACCQNLVSLKLKFACLSMDDLNPMPMLTSLTLAFIRLEDKHLNELNKCFPNLQVLNLVYVKGLKDPKIHLLNLRICYWNVYFTTPSLTLIAPNLITLQIKCIMPVALHVEAPMLSHLHLNLYARIARNHEGTFTVKRFEKLRTLWLDSSYIGSFLSKFPITKTVESLTLGIGNKARRVATESKLTLGKVFTVFPNVTSLCIKSGAWSELEACLTPQGCEILDGRKGLKTIYAYLKLVDPSLTFSSVACVFDQSVSLSEVSLLIHTDVDIVVSKGFSSKCVARWPGLKWRWGMWSDEMEDYWITDGSSN